MTLNKMQLEYNTFIVNSVAATIPTLYDRVLLDTIDNKDEALNG